MKLWSLWDMLSQHGADFALAVQLMGGMRAWLNCDSAMGMNSPALLSFFIGEQVRPVVERLPVSKTLKDQLIILQADAQNAEDTPENCRIIGTRVEVFMSSFVSELSNVLFLTMDAANKDLYEQPEPLFGVAVSKRFSAANMDIEAAGECMALEQWNAAVFHLMRVLERGLRTFAKRLGVTMKVEIDLANWQEIIEAIETEIQNRLGPLGKSKRTGMRDKTLQHYSEIALNFRYFRDAWRNHVAHGRASYDEKQARRIFEHVRNFMQSLTDRPPR